MANIALAMLFRALGKPVLWGFGRNIDTFREFRSPVGAHRAW